VSLYPTKTRLTLLGAIDRGKVKLSHSGVILRYTNGHANRRADASTRELEQAGWVRLGPDGGTYELTGDGRAVLDGAP
jgi:hypothetical protein